jgi:hypothetical protein
MSRTTSHLVAALATLLVSGTAFGQVIDDFEGYADTAALAGTWQDQTGTPTQTLAVVPGDPPIGNNGGGSQSMRIDYDLASGDQIVRDTFPAENWSAEPDVGFWGLGGAGNSGVIQMFVGSSPPCGLSWATTDTSWARYSMNFSVACPTANLSAVTYVEFWFAGGTSDAGTFYIDDLNFDNSVPVELQDLSAD